MRINPSMLVSIVVLGVVLAPSTAWANELDDVPPSTTLDAVVAATPGTIAQQPNQSVTEEGDGDLIYSRTDGSRVTVPRDPSEGVSLQGDKTTWTIDLPNAENADNGTRIDSGVVEYDNNDGSTTVPVIQDDASVQINTVIQNSNAPADYTYEITVPGGGHLSLDESKGLVSILDASGTWVGGVNPAWAKDASGATLPTWYTVDGPSTLTQHVDFTRRGVQFPVVADPWMGSWLVDHVWYGKRASWAPGDTLMVYPTGWGRYWSGQLVWPAQWGDVLAKTPAQYRGAVNRANMINQFFCHLQLGAHLWKDSYNLDTWIYRSSLASYLYNRCN